MNRKIIFTLDVEKPYPDAEKGVDTYLELFREYDLKATFFVTGDVATEAPEIVEAILKEGHEVASHGWRHPYISQPGHRRDYLTCLSHPEEFLNKSKMLFSPWGVIPRGFRAMGFQMTQGLLARLPDYFEYDSSILSDKKRGLTIPAALHEISPSTMPGTFIPMGTPVLMNPLMTPKLFFQWSLRNPSGPLVFYGHSFDFIACSVKLYAPLWKQWIYFRRCGPQQKKKMALLLKLYLNAGFRFNTCCDELLRFQGPEPASVISQGMPR